MSTHKHIYWYIYKYIYTNILARLPILIYCLQPHVKSKQQKVLLQPNLKKSHSFSSSL